LRGRGAGADGEDQRQQREEPQCSGFRHTRFPPCPSHHFTLNRDFSDSTSYNLKTITRRAAIRYATITAYAIECCRKGVVHQPPPFRGLTGSVDSLQSYESCPPRHGQDWTAPIDR
jgi:hypothetical protein